VEGVSLDTAIKVQPGGDAQRVSSSWIFALLAVSAVAGVLGVFWLKKVSPILQVERRYESVVDLAKAKGVDPTLLMAVCVTERAFSGEKAREDAVLAKELSRLLALTPKPVDEKKKPRVASSTHDSTSMKPEGPSPEQRAWMHQVLQQLLGSYEAASFAYDLKERHRVRWGNLISGSSKKGK